MAFINETQILGLIINSATETTFGSIFLTLMFLLLVLIAICLMFGIRLEYLSIIILPLLLAYASYSSDFVGMLTVIIIYLSIVFTKNFIFR